MRCLINQLLYDKQHKHKSCVNCHYYYNENDYTYIFVNKMEITKIMFYLTPIQESTCYDLAR